MTEQGYLAAQFERWRPHLSSVASTPPHKRPNRVEKLSSRGKARAFTLIHRRHDDYPPGCQSPQ